MKRFSVEWMDEGLTVSWNRLKLTLDENAFYLKEKKNCGHVLEKYWHNNNEIRLNVHLIEIKNHLFFYLILSFCNSLYYIDIHLFCLQNFGSVGCAHVGCAVTLISTEWNMCQGVNSRQISWTNRMYAVLVHAWRCTKLIEFPFDALVNDRKHGWNINGNLNSTFAMCKKTRLLL